MWVIALIEIRKSNNGGVSFTQGSCF